MSLRVYANDPRIITEPDGSYSIIDRTASSYWHVLGDYRGWSGVDSVSGGPAIHRDTADEVIFAIIGDPQK